MIFHSGSASAVLAVCCVGGLLLLLLLALPTVDTHHHPARISREAFACRTLSHFHIKIARAWAGAAQAQKQTASPRMPGCTKYGNSGQNPRGPNGSQDR